MTAVIVSPRAARQFAAGLRWWLQNRDKAPEAFADDFAAILETIAANPRIGLLGKTRNKNARRVFMERVRYYVYYRVTSSDSVEIISIWHASRRPPRL